SSLRRAWCSRRAEASTPLDLLPLGLERAELGQHHVEVLLPQFGRDGAQDVAHLPGDLTEAIAQLPEEREVHLGPVLAAEALGVLFEDPVRLLAEVAEELGEAGLRAGLADGADLGLVALAALPD